MAADSLRLERAHHSMFSAWTLANIQARQAYERSRNSTHNQPKKVVREREKKAHG